MPAAPRFTLPEALSAGRYAWGILLLVDCYSTRNFARQEILEAHKDAQGRITLKKYRQWISNPAHDGLATITEEYDTLGRVIKEYGFDNPYKYDKHYLVETSYRGTYPYLVNEYIWRASTLRDTAFTYNYRQFDSTLEMFAQHIYPDSTKKNKQLTITLSAKGKGLYYGYFQETFPQTESSWTSDLYSFDVLEKDIRFDSSRRLVLTGIRKR